MVVGGIDLVQTCIDDAENWVMHHSQANICLLAKPLTSTNRFRFRQDFLDGSRLRLDNFGHYVFSL